MASAPSKLARSFSLTALLACALGCLSISCTTTRGSPSGPGAKARSCAQSGCHKVTLGSGTAAPHPAAKLGRCSGCHSAKADSKATKKRPHPAMGVAEKRLAGVCASCHKKPIAKAKHLHGPVAVGQCSPCHTPHGDKATLLAATGKQLCFRCHQQSRLGAHMTKTQGKRCLDCHGAHGGETQSLLIKK